RAVLAGGGECEAPSPAADLEDVVAGPEAEVLADAPQLPHLRLLQRIALRPDRARVGHGLVEEEPVQVVAEVVVVADVAAGPVEALARRDVRPCALEPREQRVAPPALDGADHQLEEERQVVAAPLARDVPLAEPEPPPPH